LNLLKAVQNLRDCHWSAFKSGGCYAACFSKENCSSATCLPDFNAGKIAPGQFSKAIGPTPRHQLSANSKTLPLN
jgi:hypothetical protein